MPESVISGLGPIAPNWGCIHILFVPTLKQKEELDFAKFLRRVSLSDCPTPETTVHCPIWGYASTLIVIPSSSSQSQINTSMRQLVVACSYSL
jgi:hypothetical protein